MKKKSKLKILYLSQFHQIGGGETALLYLLEKINRKKIEPIVILPKAGQFSQKLKNLAVTTHFLYLNPFLIRTLFVPGISPLGIYNFLKLSKKIKPDLIHTNHLNLAIYAGIAAKILKIPVVATSHGSWDSIYFYHDLVSNLFVDKILANTQAIKKTLTKRKIIPSRKVEVIHLGINTGIFKPSNQKAARKILNLPPDKLIITIVGRLDPAKDHLTFLKAADKVAKQVKNSVFLIVGSQKGDFTGIKNQYLKTLKQYLRQHPSLARKVISVGFIDNMPAVYQSSDILVSSSISESFGLGLAEAAACSLPIVSTNVGSQKLIVHENKNGFLVPPKRADLLAEKIQILANNPQLRIRFGVYGRANVIFNFRLESYVEKVEKIYEELLR